MDRSFILRILNSLEIVQIKSPDHGTSVALVDDMLGLLPDDVGVVEADPLVALVGVGAHGPGGALHHGPAALFDKLADLEEVCVIIRPIMFFCPIFVILATWFC